MPVSVLTYLAVKNAGKSLTTSSVKFLQKSYKIQYISYGLLYGSSWL